MVGILGVVIGMPENLDKIPRIHTYVRKLKEVEKAPFDIFGNVGCFCVEEFLDPLEQARHEAA